MSDSEWMNLRANLRRLEGKVSMRKMRLFAIACCLRVEFLMTDEDAWGRQALELAEKMVEQPVKSAEVEEVRDRAWYAGFRLIDGFRKESDLNARSNAIFAAYHALQEASDPTYYSPPTRDVPAQWSDFMEVPFDASCAAADSTGAPPPSPVRDKAFDDETRVQIGILRDIFGSTFRSITIEPSCLAWKNGAVPELAQAIYDQRAFERMPLLAEALRDAGCTNADILDHCRSSGEHVRGCWVVDLLLGKD
jgi:hypothetical protein